MSTLAANLAKGRRCVRFTDSPVSYTSELDSNPSLTNSPQSSLSSLTDIDYENVIDIPRSPPQLADRRLQLLDTYDWCDDLQDSTKASLNPDAQAFVPTFFLLGQSKAQLPQVAGDSIYETQPTPVPCCPPGLVHPSAGEVEPVIPPRRRAPVAYAHIILKLTTDYGLSTAEARKSYISEIINDPSASASRWDMHDMHELTELLASRIFDGDVSSMPDPLRPCDPKRYIPLRKTNRFNSYGDSFGPTPKALTPEEKAMEEKLENRISDIANELHEGFCALRTNSPPTIRDLPQEFMWNLRESVLSKFMSFWDPTRSSAITLCSNPSPQTVYHAFKLCKFISVLFNRNIVLEGHITQCIALLLSNLTSIEHLEAISLIIYGCGKPYWYSYPALESILPRPECDCAQCMEEYNKEAKRLTSLKMKPQAHEFSTQVSACGPVRDIDDNKTVLGTLEGCWGEGQFKALAKEVSGTVKMWETMYFLG